jgi:hypothetical protein
MLTLADDILRGRGRTLSDALLDDARRQGLSRRLLTLLGLVLVFGLTYGALMGTFGGIRGDRLLQVVYSAAKVPLLLVVTFLIALPSFFVLNSLLGVREDFRAVLAGLVTTQAALTIILASLAPFTLFWYASSGDYQAAILFNAMMFSVASVSAQFVLYRFYRPLIARNRAHGTLFRTWLALYAFVGIQMGWVLRPFVGNPALPVTFFRQGAWGNAYVEVARIVWKLVSR